MYVAWIMCGSWWNMAGMIPKIFWKYLKNIWNISKYLKYLKYICTLWNMAGTLPEIFDGNVVCACLPCRVWNSSAHLQKGMSALWWCVYVCVCVCVCVCECVDVNLCRIWNSSAHLQKCMSALWWCVRVRVCVYVCLCMWMHACMHLCMLTEHLQRYMWCIHVNVCAYSYMHACAKIFLKL